MKDAKLFEDTSFVNHPVVYCKNCGRVDVTDTEFLNIEEDEMGRDLYTFRCLKCGAENKSNVWR